MHTTRIGLFLMFLGIFSCGKKVATPEESKLYGLASPIQLKHGDNLIFLDDYFPENLKIDSAKLDSDLPVKLISETNTLQVNCSTSDIPFLMNLSVYAEGIPYGILVKSPTDVLQKFEFSDENTHTDVRVKGEFNNWNADHDTFVKDSLTDKWICEVKVKPGKFQYKFVVDGIELNDPANVEVVSNGMGGTNSVLSIPEVPDSILPNLITDRFDAEKIFIQVENTTKLYAYWENFRVDVQASEDEWMIQIPPFAKYEPRSHIRVYACSDVGIGNDLLIPLEKGKVLNDPAKLNNSDWHSSIMYFMMVDRFLDGDAANNAPVADPAILPKANYMGGDLKGITQKINDGYFRKLGINTIWISPITQNPEDAWGQFKDPDTKFSGYHGYWPISSSKVDHRFGNSADLKELLSTAHANGISVLLDYVANHVHQQHPVYQQHKNWVTPLYLPDGTMNTERWDDHRLTTWFDTFMPTLNLMEQHVTDFMVDSASFWIKEYDFDGFRHDATKHIPENFWRSLTKEVKAQSQKSGKYIYQIGETYGSRGLINSYIGSGMLDGQFDFNLYDDAVMVFAKTDIPFSRLTNSLTASLKTYGQHHLMGNITGNQDKPRFISFADGSLDFNTPGIEQKRIGWKNTIGIRDSSAYDKLAMFNAFNMTIPGIPIVYYGDEIGMPGAGDPDNRRMMKFANLNFREAYLKSQIERLTKVRSQNMALLYGDFNMLETTDTFMVYRRKYFDNTVVVMLNKGAQDQQFEMPTGETILVKSGGFAIDIQRGTQHELVQ